MADRSTAQELRLDAFIPFRLSYTSNLVSDRIARTYEAMFGLSIPEWRLVAVIAEGVGVTQAAIGQRTRMDKVTVSRAAIALTARGLLARGDNPDDRRSHLLTLTDAGRDLYAAVAPKALELERRLFAALPRAELEAFVATLRRIDAAALALDEERLTT
ncbi:MarR family winged helix-turn-helix transcriptional regulator [Sphingomonas rubra]|uniref:DNA-binding transcriptional regulator, MarR family n=1 Tax=Sphingomonas rubra TaxID=634430 RepID=A0A1I5TWX3_9SPHN|nr:MarR family winged helix-turn-helix transcriptional regulator [Sphingomonas rubra]SFP87580.1 DNA-binding transcriptional regulator, MarR family [Sphingomonas rubra]